MWELHGKKVIGNVVEEYMDMSKKKKDMSIGIEDEDEDDDDAYEDGGKATEATS